MMTPIMKILSDLSRAGLVAVLALALPILAQAEQTEGAQADVETNVRVMAMEAEAVITAIDLETREVTLQGPNGESFTLDAQEEVVKLEDVKVGDAVVVTYLAALESQLREPTAEEIAEPWLELDEEVVSDDAAHPGIADMRVIRAVVTIEEMNPELGAVTIKDSRGKLHVIGGVEPEKMEGVTIGQSAVMVFSQALALTLQKKEDASE